MIPITTKNYVRIDKRTARKLYATGAADLYFCPVNYWSVSRMQPT